MRTPPPHLPYPYPPLPQPHAPPPGDFSALLRRYGPAALIGVVVLVFIGAAVVVDRARWGEHLTPEQRARLEALSQRPATAPVSGEVGTGLSVISYPTGAVVQVEFDSVGVTPLLTHELEPGIYFVSLLREGFVPFDTLVFVDDGEVSPLYVALRPSEGGEETAFPRPLEERAERPVARGSEPVADARPRSEPPPVRTTEAPPARREPARASRRSPEAQARAEPVTPVVPAAPEPVPPATREREVPAERTSGSLRVASDPSGAPVFLDGRRVGETPLNVPGVEAGTYEVVLRLDGHRPHRETVQVWPDGVAEVRATLAKPTGEVSILVQPWGSIFIDGALHRQDTDVQYQTRLPVGTYQVRVLHPHLGAMERTVEISEGGTERLVFDLNRR